MNKIEEFIVTMDNIGVIDAPIYDMIMCHYRADKIFVSMDKPKERLVGWGTIGEDFSWLGIRVVEIQQRKRSRILDTCGFGTELLLTSKGRKLVSEVFTNKNSSKYISMPNLKSVMIMNEALE